MKSLQILLNFQIVFNKIWFSNWFQSTKLSLKYILPKWVLGDTVRENQLTSLIILNLSRKIQKLDLGLLKEFESLQWDWEEST